jgi:hypothetical protein
LHLLLFSYITIDMAHQQDSADVRTQQNLSQFLPLPRSPYLQAGIVPPSLFPQKSMHSFLVDASWNARTAPTRCILRPLAPRPSIKVPFAEGTRCPENPDQAWQSCDNQPVKGGFTDTVVARLLYDP